MFLSQHEELLLTWQLRRSASLACLSHSVPIVDKYLLMGLSDEVYETRFGVVISSPIRSRLLVRDFSVSVSFLLCITRFLCSTWLENV